MLRTILIAALLATTVHVTARAARPTDAGADFVPAYRNTVLLSEAEPGGDLAHRDQTSQRVADAVDGVYHLRHVTLTD